jgi:peptidoglycan/xylan/chitin deacetylase (PgdA/CDA1 family)
LIPRLEILAFHRILCSGESYFIPPMVLARETFMRLIEQLSIAYRILDLSHAVSLLRNGSMPERCLALTFDDGYLDNYVLASEFLTTKGFPATFFLPLKQIDSGRPYWWDYVRWIAECTPDRFQSWINEGPLPLKIDTFISSSKGSSDFSPSKTRSLVRILNTATREVRARFLEAAEREFGPYRGPRLLMNWDEARTLCDHGFAIGSHTVSHEPLTDLESTDAISEIEDSRIALSQRLNRAVSGFCYPRGAHSSGLAAAVQNAGYSYAVTTRYGSNRHDTDIFALRRRNMADYAGLRALHPVLFQRLEVSGIMDGFLSKRRSPQ